MTAPAAGAATISLELTAGPKKGRGRPRTKPEKKPNPVASALAKLRWKGVPPDERRAHSDMMNDALRKKQQRKSR